MFKILEVGITTVLLWTLSYIQLIAEVWFKTKFKGNKKQNKNKKNKDNF